jgi:hypothetical protein
VPALVFCFALILAVATGAFCLADALSDYRTDWAVSLCHQAPNLCANPHPLVYATGVMFIVYLFLELADRH